MVSELHSQEVEAMQTPDGSWSPEEFDGDRAMGRVLALGAALGIPATFVASLALLLAAGATWPGVLAIAAWAALVGGTFCGGALMLARKMAELDERSRGFPPSEAPPTERSAPSRRAAGVSAAPAGGSPGGATGALEQRGTGAERRRGPHCLILHV